MDTGTYYAYTYLPSFNIHTMHNPHTRPNVRIHGATQNVRYIDMGKLKHAARKHGELRIQNELRKTMVLSKYIRKTSRSLVHYYFMHSKLLPFPPYLHTRLDL